MAFNYSSKRLNSLLPKQTWRTGHMKDFSLYINLNPTSHSNITNVLLKGQPFLVHFQPSCLRSNMEKTSTLEPTCTMLSGRGSAPAIPSGLSPSPHSSLQVPCSRLCGSSVTDVSEAPCDTDLRELLHAHSDNVDSRAWACYFIGISSFLLCFLACSTFKTLFKARK